MFSLSDLSVRRIGLALLAVVALASALYGWFRTPDPVTVTEYRTLPGKTVEQIKRVPYAVKEIQVIEKEAAAKKLDLPDRVRLAPELQVLAAGEVPPYKGKTDVVAVIDTATGVAVLDAKRRPLPFLQFENDKEIGLRYGVGTGGNVATVYGRWTVLRVGAVHLAGYGEISQDAQAKAMLEASYRW